MLQETVSADIRTGFPQPYPFRLGRSSNLAGSGSWKRGIGEPWYSKGTRANSKEDSSIAFKQCAGLSPILFMEKVWNWVLDWYRLGWRRRSKWNSYAGTCLRVFVWLRAPSAELSSIHFEANILRNGETKSCSGKGYWIEKYGTFRMVDSVLEIEMSTSLWSSTKRNHNSGAVHEKHLAVLKFITRLPLISFKLPSCWNGVTGHRLRWYQKDMFIHQLSFSLRYTQAWSF